MITPTPDYYNYNNNELTTEVRCESIVHAAVYVTGAVRRGATQQTGWRRTRVVVVVVVVVVGGGRRTRSGPLLLVPKRSGHRVPARGTAVTPGGGLRVRSGH